MGTSNVVVEMRGGVVQQVSCDNPDRVNVIILDWDEPDASVMPVSALYDSPSETLDHVIDHLKR